MSQFLSPYLPLTDSSCWLRGNHHGHSTRSDGMDEPLAVMRAYEAAGYDYFPLSEHDYLLPPAELQPHTTMCILPAVEVTSFTIHRLGVSADGQTIQVAADADEIRWITYEGRIFKKSRQPEDQLTVAEFMQNKVVRPLTDHVPYVRIECLGRGNALAWSQPFWLHGYTHEQHRK